MLHGIPLNAFSNEKLMIFYKGKYLPPFYSRNCCRQRVNSILGKCYVSNNISIKQLCEGEFKTGQNCPKKGKHSTGQLITRCTIRYKILMLWDEISMVWNFNAILGYGKCCNRYAWTDNECVVCLHLLEKNIVSWI